ncbi:MAG: preprotein translocase subunit SecE [Anaerolineae bacterium]|nr:preprotein translocase subunit SecE [Anaerolineae bacterium]
MARITTRRPEEDEDLIEDAEELDEEQVSAAPVSDRRRRRQAKRGELPEAPSIAAVEPTRKDRPTPSQRQEVEKSSNIVVRVYQDVVEYLQETKSELQKVAWLNREDTLRLTWIVIAVTAVSAIVLGLVGFIFALLTQSIATASSTTIAGVLTIGLIIVVGGLWLFRERLFGGHFE